jgi:hypothetical protein
MAETSVTQHASPVPPSDEELGREFGKLLAENQGLELKKTKITLMEQLVIYDSLADLRPLLLATNDSPGVTSQGDGLPHPT